MATVLITGANKGVGLEMTRLYAAKGDRVLACCRNAAAATALAELAKKSDVVVCEVQVSNGDSVAKLAKTLAGQPIDILINNAGASGPAFDQQTVFNMDFAGWAENFEINTMAPVRVMQALMDNLKASKSAKVVTITSQMGAMSLDMPMAYAYCTSKAAVNKFMKLAAVDLAKLGISVCLIHPGWVKTDMGGPNAAITPEESAAGVVAAIEGLSPATTGSFWKWDGEVHGW